MDHPAGVGRVIWPRAVAIVAKFARIGRLDRKRIPGRA